MFCLFLVAFLTNEAGEAQGICVEVRSHHVFVLNKQTKAAAVLGIARYDM